MVVYYIFTLGFVIAWEGYSRRLQTSSASLVLGGITAASIGLLIQFFVANPAIGIREILLFDSINVGSGLLASGYGIALGGTLLYLLRLWKSK